MFGIGMGEFILIVIVGLLVFGVDRLPEYGRSLAKLFREFRKAQNALTTALQEVENDTKPSSINTSKTSAVESNPITSEVSTDSNNNSTVNQNTSTSNNPQNENSVKTVEQLTALINENPVKINKNINLSKETGE